MSAHPPVFATIADLTTPQTLTALLGISDGPWQLRRAPMSGGLSGATLERLTLSDGDRYAGAILKRIDPRANWLMRASGDTALRELRLTQSPLWEALPNAVWDPVLGVATEDGVGALLLPDLSPVVYPASLCYDPADDDLVARILDRIASLHATLWEHPALRAQEWLTSPAAAYFALAPDRLSQATYPPTEEDTYGDQATRMWPFLWKFIDGADADPLWHTLARPEALLAASAGAPATLAHGDTWVANMGGLTPSAIPTSDPAAERLVLLDWALATAGPATFDSLWLAQTWRALDPYVVLAQHRAALLRHGVTTVADDATWALLADLGWVRTFFMGAEWMVRDVRGATTDEEDAKARARLNSWSHHTVEILAERGW
ncbi:MAG: hypothetical protein H0X24_04905 [Ktedonobacterales bacterium]|nr:hypothetical protein [Ktedonobacterales bacterium]